ncbi:MAG: fructose-bisphosphatase class III, partial [Clostridia bacterium]|nr:fructose-bisphosphatase class III [Clostridia bacterium]
MTYVISDVHGCYDKFTRLLETIRFSQSDKLYILGDLVDRGEGGIKLILDVMKRPNVVCLVGNHDWTMASLLGNRRQIIEQIGKEQTLELFEMWFSDGGETPYKS